MQENTAASMVRSPASHHQTIRTPTARTGLMFCVFVIAYGYNLYCNADYACCEGSVVWECIPETAECCTRGTLCYAGSHCMKDSSGNYYCLTSGGASASPSSGATAVNTGGSQTPIPTPTDSSKKSNGSLSTVGVSRVLILFGCWRPLGVVRAPWSVAHRNWTNLSTFFVLSF
jgi:hypothetical protein